MYYTCICLEPIELEEQVLRWGATEKKVVVVSAETLGREATLTSAVTAASVQGDTCEGTVRIGDLDNPHMRKKDMLEMAAGRATTAANLRFI